PHDPTAVGEVRRARRRVRRRRARHADHALPVPRHPPVGADALDEQAHLAELRPRRGRRLRLHEREDSDRADQRRCELSLEHEDEAPSAQPKWQQRLSARRKVQTVAAQSRSCCKYRRQLVSSRTNVPPPTVRAAAPPIRSRSPRSEVTSQKSAVSRAARAIQSSAVSPAVPTTVTSAPVAVGGLPSKTTTAWTPRSRAHASQSATSRAAGTFGQIDRRTFSASTKTVVTGRIPAQTWTSGWWNRAHPVARSAG